MYFILEFYAKPMSGEPPGPPPGGFGGDDGGRGPPLRGGGEGRGEPGGDGDGGLVPLPRDSEGDDGGQGVPGGDKQREEGGLPASQKPFFDGTSCNTPIKIEDFVNAMSAQYLKVRGIDWIDSSYIFHNVGPLHTGCKFQ